MTKDNRLAEMIANNEISIQELAEAKELIEVAQFVEKGLEACKKVLMFPLGVDEISCYRYMDNAGEYEAWGRCLLDGTFYCYCNWGGNHEIGRCNLNNEKEVFLQLLNNKEFCNDLKKFLERMIKAAEKG